MSRCNTTTNEYEDRSEIEYLTYDGLSILIDVKPARAVMKQTRQVKKIFYRPSKIVWVDDEMEQVHGPRCPYDPQHLVLLDAVRLIPSFY